MIKGTKINLIAAYRNMLLTALFLPAGITALAQFAPPAGQAGTTAVHKDSSAIVGWANHVEEFHRGAADIANGWGTLTSFGTADEALGYAQGNSTDVVSLGDSGYITLAFAFPIMNGPGNDFAVFENSFSDDYLEFAHVEVSSDGIKFIRIPSVSLVLTGTQTATYANTITEQIHNLAGKYRQGFGTPFDLEDIADSSGINLDSVLFVRIVDVIGSIHPTYGSYDSQGALINDPYPTGFAAGGFDLDGVGVMNENNIYAAIHGEEQASVLIFPNPAEGIINIRCDADLFHLNIYDASGRAVISGENYPEGIIGISLEPGIYLIEIISREFRKVEKIVIR